MAHKYRMVKLYNNPKPELKGMKKAVRRLRSVTVIHTGRGGRRILGVETSIKKAQELIDVDRGELHAHHANRHPNDHKFFSKHGVQ